MTVWEVLSLTDFEFVPGKQEIKERTRKRMHNSRMRATHFGGCH